MNYEEIKELQKVIPDTTIIKKDGFDGWTYALFDNILNVELCINKVKK